MMHALRRSRAVLLAPLSMLVGASLLAVALASDPPGVLDPARAFAGPTLARPLGSGEGGIDLAVVLAHALARGLLLAGSVALFGLAVGTPLGAAAALARGRIERAVERACDLVQSFPTFLVALAVLSAVRSPGRVYLACVFAATAWAPFARLALVQTRVLRDAAFVEAARALGLAPFTVLRRHVLPQLLGVAAVQLGSSAAAVVVSEASLAFVGLGPRDGVSLGALLDQGAYSMLRAPHVLLVAAVSIALASASLLMAGLAARSSSGAAADSRPADGT